MKLETSGALPQTDQQITYEYGVASNVFLPSGYQIDPIPEAPILPTFMANFNVSQEDLDIWRGDAQLRLCVQFFQD